MQNFENKICDSKVKTLYSDENEKMDPSLAQVPKARPIVNPKAEGNVDPHLYPQPKEATHKIRSKNDFIEYLFGAVDQELLTVKTFYFFFYSAFGSLFPLMGVYFKQMGMNAGQCGLLIGLRPFIEFFSAPFWGSWADRWQKGKLILLASLACWIIFTLPLGFIQPPATSCMIYKNHTNFLYIPDNDQRILKRSITVNDLLYENSTKNLKKRIKLESKQLNKKNVKVILPILEQKIHNKFHNNYYRNKRNELNTKIFGNKIILQNTKKINLNDLIRNNKISSTLEYKKSLKNNSLRKDKTKYKSKKNINKYIMTNEIRNPIKKMSHHDAAYFYSSSGLSNLKIKGLRKLLFTKYDRYNFDDSQHYQPEQIILINDDENNRISSLNKFQVEIYNTNVSFQRHRRNTKMSSSGGQSPIPVNYAANYNDTDHKGWVKPIFSSIVYRLPDIQKTFFLLLLLVIVGEFFSAPAITLADSAVITLLGEDADRYGHQRMFGSLGWGLSMFFVGIALDHSTAFPEHPCGPDPKEKNYTICFAIFSVLMGAALITATQINFKYDPVSMESDVQKSPVEPTREEQLQSQLGQQLNLPSLQDSLNTHINSRAHHTEDKTKMFAQTTREIPEWMTILKQFKDLKCASFLFVAWFMGFGIGLIFTFLFWHLQDYGGTPTLFGVASVINHISEIFAYFFSFKLIRQIGHVKVLCLGLGGNVLRFLYISWLKNPWWVLPFEFIQGITHAAVWAACCSYIAHNTPTPLRSNAQSVLQGLHHGLGRGCGAVIGGMFVTIYGTTTIFQTYGLICLIVLVAFIFINFYRKDTGFVSNLPPAEDPHQVAEVTHLAPHGVPSNAIPRALSSNRLHELSNQDSSYGATYHASSSSLSIPGKNGVPMNSNNPFLSGINQGDYHYKIADKGNDEFIRRSFQCYSEIVNTELDIVKIPLVTTHLHIQQPCTNPFHQHDYDW